MDEVEKKMTQAILLGAQIMIDKGVPEYRVKITNRRRALADCNSFYKVIRFSSHFIKIATKEQFEGVTLHEIAHALVGNVHGHDSVFKAKCRELGADTSYHGCSAKGVILPKKFKLTCPECGASSGANMRKDYICSRCKANGKNVRFTFEENILQVVQW